MGVRKGEMREKSWRCGATGKGRRCSGRPSEGQHLKDLMTQGITVTKGKMTLCCMPVFKEVSKHRFSQFHSVPVKLTTMNCSKLPKVFLFLSWHETPTLCTKIRKCLLLPWFSNYSGLDQEYQQHLALPETYWIQACTAFGFLNDQYTYYSLGRTV